MRIIKYIAPIPVQDFEGKTIVEKSVSIGEFIRGRLNETSFGVSMDAITAAVRIDRATRVVPEGTDIQLEESDWKMLKEATEKPKAGYQPVVAKNFLTFMKAIVDAQEVNEKTLS